MIVEINVPKFEDFNPRKDLKSTSWVRLNNNFWRSHDMFGLSGSEKFIYIICLSECSEKMSETVRINLELVSAHCQMECTDIVRTLEIFQEKQMLNFKKVDVTPTLRERTTTNERTNKQTICPKKNFGPVQKDLLKIYDAYPRKEKKSVFITKAKKKLKADDVDNFLKAVENYKAWITKNGKEDFVKLITTFLSEWEDWLEDGNGKITIKETSRREMEYDDMDWDRVIP